MSKKIMSTSWKKSTADHSLSPSETLAFGPVAADKKENKESKIEISEVGVEAPHQFLPTLFNFTIE